MAFDKMDWHYGSENFPKYLPDKNGGTHIGMYLAWIIENKMIGTLHQEDSQDEIGKVLAHEWTGRDFLINTCDEKFWECDLDEEGKRFTNYYYGEKGYYDDYVKIVGDSTAGMYEFEDSWGNYQKVKSVISQRYKEWRAKTRWSRWLNF